MVFRHFELVGFPVKCVEAGWLPKRIMFAGLAVFLIAVPFGFPKRIICRTCCLHFGTLGAILTAWGHPGGPSEQQGAHVELPNLIYKDFELIVLGSDVLHSMFFRTCFQVAFCVDFRMESLIVGGIKTRLSYGMYCKNNVFAKNVFW